LEVRFAASVFTTSRTAVGGTAFGLRTDHSAGRVVGEIQRPNAPRQRAEFDGTVGLARTCCGGGSPNRATRLSGKCRGESTEAERNFRETRIGSAGARRNMARGRGNA